MAAPTARELLSTPDQFLVWLHQNRNEGIGQEVGKIATTCPIARFLKARTGNPYCVTAAHYSQMLPSIESRVRMPKWGHHFVLWFDRSHTSAATTGFACLRYFLEVKHG